MVSSHRARSGSSPLHPNENRRPHEPEPAADEASNNVQFCDGVFSAKYSWLSALSVAFLGCFASRLQAFWP